MCRLGAREEGVGERFRDGGVVHAGRAGRLRRRVGSRENLDGYGERVQAGRVKVRHERVAQSLEKVGE